MMNRWIKNLSDIMVKTMPSDKINHGKPKNLLLKMIRDTEMTVIFKLNWVIPVREATRLTRMPDSSILKK